LNTAAETTYTVRYDRLIERGGKREIRTELTTYQLNAGEAQMLDEARTQLYQLRQDFTTAALARDNLALAETTRQEYDQTIRLTEAKVENGDLARVELYRAQVAALPYQQAVQQARTSYQQATRDILNLLGARAEDVSLIKPVVDDNKAQVVNASFHTGEGAIDSGRANSLIDAPLDIEFKFDDRPISQTLAELRAIALVERPDVIASRSRYGAANKAVALAMAQRTRDVLVGVFYQRTGSDNTAGVNVSFPLLVYNKGYAAISQAAAQQESAISLAREAELQAVFPVVSQSLPYTDLKSYLRRRALATARGADSNALCSKAEFIYAQPLDPKLKRRSRQPQRFRRSCRPRNAATRSAQGRLDGLAFLRLKPFVHTSRNGSARQHVPLHAQRAVAREYHRPLDHVLQFARVAGPMIRGQ